MLNFFFIANADTQDINSHNATSTPDALNRLKEAQALNEYIKANPNLYNEEINGIKLTTIIIMGLEMLP